MNNLKVQGDAASSTAPERKLRVVNTEVPPGVKPGTRNTIRLMSKMTPAKLTKKEIFDDNGRLGLFSLEPLDGSLIPDFIAGQYTNVGIEIAPEFFVNRPYSIASSPNEKDAFEFFIALVDDGALTPHMFKAEVGDTWHFYKTIGKFTLDKTERPNYFFISTGTGLAPFRSMSKFFAEEGDLANHNIITANGVSYLPELGYQAELDGYQAKHSDSYLYIPTVSRPTDAHPADISAGRVNEIIRLLVGSKPNEGRNPQLGTDITPERVRKICPPSETAVFLCGNPDMIKDLEEPLAEAGYDEVHVEEYW